MATPNMLPVPARIPNGLALGFIDIRDPRDENYPVAPRLAAAAPPPLTQPDPVKYWWDNGWWGDQGELPECTAYSGLHALEDGPLTIPSRTPGAGPILQPTPVYQQAQRNDEWWGENYDGTSVRAVAKVFQAAGLISGYRWAWTVEDVAEAVRLLGPVIFGTWWYTSMFYPDPQGFLRIRGSAARAGGHAYLVNGVNMERGLFRVKNSWGRGWGVGGRAWMPFDVARRLLAEDGEACIYTEVVQP